MTGGLLTLSEIDAAEARWGLFPHGDPWMVEDDPADDPGSEGQVPDDEPLGDATGVPSADDEVERLRAELERLRLEVRQAPTALQKTLLARHEQRPYTLDYVERLFTDFLEIHGDRRYRDDPAIVTGMARYHGRPVMVVGQQKGRDLKQRQFRNFGYAQPEGYRKALRAMKLAEKFSRPIVTFVDTPGAYPSVGAEERGPGGGDRLQPTRDVTAHGPGRCLHHRRRGERRRPRDRRRQPHLDARERDLHGDHAAGLLGDPVEGPGPCRGGCRRAAPDRFGSRGLRYHRRDRAGAPGRSAERLRCGRAPAR